MTRSTTCHPPNTSCCKKHAIVTAVIFYYKKTLPELKSSSQKASAPVAKKTKAQTKPVARSLPSLTSLLRTVQKNTVKLRLPTPFKQKNFSLPKFHLNIGKKIARDLNQLSKLLPKKKRKRGRPKKKKIFRFWDWFTSTVVFDYFYSFFVVIRELPLFFLVSIVVSMALFSGFSYLYTEIFLDLPSPEELKHKPLPVSTRILDRNGNVLYRIYEDENRTIVPLSEMPISLIQATIAIEDQDFYNHHGFSLRGILRAFISNQQGESVQGGSTLTQQLVKNRLLSPERTFQRKIKELILAILVENTYSKNEILEMYLNQAPYGGSTYGIEEASQKFFGKSATFLTLSESALLAGLPASPTTFSPYGSNPELAKQRQIEVLRRMAEEGYITWEDANSAAGDGLVLTPRGVEIEAPHFVMYVRSLLADRYGEDLVANGGLLVTTTLDLATQKTAQQIVSSEVEKITNLRVSNGAALVTEPKTGAILAMVGSVDYFDFEHDGQVNVTLRPRQPGSSIKPLTYALAFEAGKKPSDYIQDTPITYTAEGSPPYSPKNYDGKYHGKVTLRESLASSYNIPAVKLLAELGVSHMLEKAPSFGITTWDDPKRFGLSLTLGGGEVLLTQMAELYGTFANQGMHTHLNPIIEVKTYDGEILYQNVCVLKGNCQSEKVITSAVAYQVTDILKDNEARTPAFGPQSTLVIPNQEVAVKTGTTNNLRDNWTIGYTSDRLVAVWVGNNDNTSMSYVASGITGASPIWNKIMRTQLDAEDPHVFAVPESITLAEVCTQTSIGMRKYTEAFIFGTPIEPKCTTQPRALDGQTPTTLFETNTFSVENARQRTRLPNQPELLLAE